MSTEESLPNRLTRPVDATDHSLGPATAPITLVEYGSYDCPHCRAANERIVEVREQFGERLRYVFRHRPVSGSDIAVRAAELMECIVDPDEFDLVHRFPADAPFALLQEQGAGAAVCVGDMDADGLPDLFVANYDRGGRLFRNQGDWRFEDITARSGVITTGRWCAGAAFVDIDSDEDLDLFVCAFNAANMLFINNGKGQV
jgi:hypothetical protein